MNNRISKLLFALLFAHSAASAAGAKPLAVMDARHKGLFQNHCLKCHNAKKHKGKFRFDNLPYAITSDWPTEATFVRAMN